MFEKLALTVGYGLLVACGFALWHARNASPLLGLWDTGLYDRYQMPLQESPRGSAVREWTAEEVLVLRPTAEDLAAAPTLPELLERYGLDYTLAPETARASGLISSVNPVAPEVQGLHVRAGTTLKIPLNGSVR